MFTGIVETTVDEKGRLTLERRWHLELTSGFIMTRGIEPCIYLFTPAMFELLLRDYGLSIASSDIRIFTRHLTAMAEQGTLDKQGRIMIPPNLRQFASVSDKASVIGVVNHLEIWNSNKFAEINAQSEANIAQVAEKIT